MNRKRIQLFLSPEIFWLNYIFLKTFVPLSKNYMWCNQPCKCLLRRSTMPHHSTKILRRSSGNQSNHSSTCWWDCSRSFDNNRHNSPTCRHSIQVFSKDLVFRGSTPSSTHPQRYFLIHSIGLGYILFVRMLQLFQYQMKLSKHLFFMKFYILVNMKHDIYLERCTYHNNYTKIVAMQFISNKKRDLKKCIFTTIHAMLVNHQCVPGILVEADAFGCILLSRSTIFPAEEMLSSQIPWIFILHIVPTLSIPT